MTLEVLKTRKEPESTESIPNPLSKRQTEILGLMAGGMEGSEIAEVLHISPFTVDHHRRRIYEKLGTNSKIAGESAFRSVLKGAEMGIIDPHVVFESLNLNISLIQELTPREKEVLKTMLETKTQNRDAIGELLSISPNTIHEHSMQIKARLEQETRLHNIIPAVLLYREAHRQNRL